MKNFLFFLSNFIRSPKEVGAVAPSSGFLRDEMISKIDFANAKSIVELGPGTGAFTRRILQKSKPGTRVLCLEVNKKFLEYLNKNFSDKRLKVISKSAEDIRSGLKKFKLGKADFIVSGLPFLDFPASKRRKIINEVKNSLEERGKFILFQYTTKIDNLLRSNFRGVKKTFVLLNIPPAFVYVCEK